MARFHPCWRTSCWTILTRNWNHRGLRFVALRRRLSDLRTIGTRRVSRVRFGERYPHKDTETDRQSRQKSRVSHGRSRVSRLRGLVGLGGKIRVSEKNVKKFKQRASEILKPQSRDLDASAFA